MLMWGEDTITGLCMRGIERDQKSRNREQSETTEYETLTCFKIFSEWGFQYNQQNKNLKGS